MRRWATTVTLIIVIGLFLFLAAIFVVWWLMMVGLNLIVGALMLLWAGIKKVVHRS